MNTINHNVYFKQIKYEINWIALGGAILSLMPILFGFLIFHQPMLFNVGLITISLFIPVQRINAGLYVVIVQFLLIGLGFSLLYFTLLYPYLFVMLCALLAFATIYCTKYGAGLRTLANFIFIPAVYLACELHVNLNDALIWENYRQFITMMPIALITVVIIVAGKQLFFPATVKTMPVLRLHTIPIIRHVVKGSDLGKSEMNWLKPALAIFIGVFISASFVVYLHIAHGEWVIWSTAAVISSDLSSATMKTRERLLGLVLGVPLGFFIAQFLPKTIVTYSVAMLGLMLTLVAFRRYSLAFGGRCFFVALAILYRNSCAANRAGTGRKCHYRRRHWDGDFVYDAQSHGPF